jgi:hypothetical protein
VTACLACNAPGLRYLRYRMCNSFGPISKWPQLVRTLNARERRFGSIGNVFALPASYRSRRRHGAPLIRMKTRLPTSRLAVSASLVLALTMSLGSSTAQGAIKDRTKPTTPGNFRLVSKTAYTVTVAWNPSSDNSGNFSYHLSGAYGVTPAVLPKTATSHTFTALFPGNEYWFFIYAKDAAGNVSGQGNLGAIRLPRDTTPPTTAPAVRFDEVGANYARISWIPAQDDGPHLSTQIYLDGELFASVGRGITTATLRFLEPATTYSLVLRAVDFGNNAGPFSGPVALTTPPANPNDTTSPTIPTNLGASGTGDGSTETHVSWTQSTDNFDAPSNIRYDVYVNGVLADILFGSGRSLVYVEFGENLIEVFATDTAGNTSAPATTTISF